MYNCYILPPLKLSGCESGQDVNTQRPCNLNPTPTNHDTAETPPHPPPPTLQKICRLARNTAALGQLQQEGDSLMHSVTWGAAYFASLPRFPHRTSTNTRSSGQSQAKRCVNHRGPQRDLRNCAARHFVNLRVAHKGKRQPVHPASENCNKRCTA